MCATCTHILNNAHQYNLHTRHADILYNSAVIFLLHLEFNLYGNCERSKLSGEFNGTDFLYTCIYIYIYICFRPYVVP